MVDLNKEIITERSWHKFIYADDKTKWKIFLKSLENDYPIVMDEDKPMAIYLDEIGCNKTKREENKLAFYSSQYFNTLIFCNIFRRTFELYDSNTLNNRLEMLITFLNKIFKPQTSFNSVNDIYEEFQRIRKYYEENILNGYSQINDLRINYLTWQMIVSKFKEGINNSSYFGIIVDKQHDLIIPSTKAINEFVGGRITNDLSMKVAISPNDWDTYTDFNGNFIENPHDYDTIDITDSLKLIR